jgi:hypothetical protein
MHPIELSGHGPTPRLRHRPRGDVLLRGVALIRINRQMAGTLGDPTVISPLVMAARGPGLLALASSSRPVAPGESGTEAVAACLRSCGKIRVSAVAALPEMVLCRCGARIGRLSGGTGSFRALGRHASARDVHGPWHCMVAIPDIAVRGRGCAVAERGEPGRSPSGVQVHPARHLSGRCPVGDVSLQSTGSKAAVSREAAVRGDCRIFGLQR